MVDAPLTITLSANLPDARLSQLTRDLERDLSRGGIKARAVEAAAVPGEKGEPVTIGVLALALVASGAVKALIGCLKAYVSREPALTIKLKRPDGMQVEVNALNVDASDVRAALEAAASVSSE
jgi:Effector Associated Constant Component 1